SSTPILMSGKQAGAKIMDWSIHVSSASEIQSDFGALDKMTCDSGPKLAPVVALTWQLIEEYFGVVRFTRCAYGNEFCEHLIPSAEQLKAVLTAAHDREMSVTFLTPYVSDAGIESLKPLFE